MLNTFVAAHAHERDIIVFIGAGDGEGLLLEESGYRAELILVEPHPSRAASLRNTIKNVARAKVIEAAVASADGEGTLHLFNYPAMDSLRRPTGLRQLYPGLRAAGEIEVATLRPCSLINQIGVAENCRNLLLIDVPGETLSILQELEHSGLLTRFDSIIASTGAVELYEGGSSIDSIEAWCHSSAYRLVAAADPHDPDLYRVDLRQLSHVRDNQRLRDDLAGAEQTAETQRKEIDDLRGQLKKAEAEQQALQRGLAESRAELEQKKKEVAAVTEAHKQALADLEVRDQELQARRDDLHVALRAQLIAQSDLKELQHRYGNLFSEKQAGDELLGSISERLIRAVADVEAKAIAANHTQTSRLPPPKRSKGSRRKNR